MKNVFRHINLTICCIIALAAATYVHAQSSTVIISEVLYDTPLEEANGTLNPHNGEFISFYNYGNNTVNISGWQIQIDNTVKYTFPANTYISPYGIVAVAYRATGSGFNTDSFYSSFAGSSDKLLYQSSMVLPNRTTIIKLYSNNNIVQDEILYDGDDNLPSGVPPMRAKNTLNLDRAGNLSVSLQRKNITKNSGTHIFQRSDYKGGSSSLVKLFSFNNPPALTLTRDGNTNTITRSNNNSLEINHDDDLYSIDSLWAIGGMDLGTVSESEDIPALQGTVGVSGTGAAMYELPIDIPQNAVLTPSISIIYNSQSKAESVLGLGFNLNGLSRITRTGKSFFYDGETDAPNYDTGTIFSLDGSRLIQIGSYNGNTPMQTMSMGFMGGNSNPVGIPDYLEYEVADNASFAQIRYHKNIPTMTNPQFIVKTKEGKTLYYGGTDNATAKLQNGKIHSFLLRKITDPHGNEVNYTYNNINGEEPCISEITYGSESIVFDYQPRKLTRKQVVSAGNVLLQKKLLKKILMQVSGITTHLYDITYQEPIQHDTSQFMIDANSFADGAFDFITRLTNIQKSYIAEQDTVSTLPVTFSWSPFLPSTLIGQDTLTDFTDAILNTDIHDPLAPRTQIDINGDGIMDLLDVADSKTRFLTDINGDGSAELIERYADTCGLRVYFTKADMPLRAGLDMKSRNAFESEGFALRDINDNLLLELCYNDEDGQRHRPILFGDINGDGLTDILGVFSDKIILYLNRKNLHFEKTELTNIRGSHIVSTNDTGCPDKVELKSFRLQDMNGDGRDDLVEIIHTIFMTVTQSTYNQKYFYHYTMSHEDINVYYNLINNTNKNTVYERATNWNIGEQMVTALNEQELLNIAHLASSTGVVDLSGDGITFFDINGDGLNEMFKYSGSYGSKRKFYYMNTDKVYADSSSTDFDLSDYTPVFVDINNDGLLDISTEARERIGSNRYIYAQIYFNTGFGFIKNPKWYEHVFNEQNTRSSNFLFEYIDFDGDGFCELIARDYLEYMGDPTRTNSKCFLKGRDYSDRVIERISNGRNIATSINYMRKVDTVPAVSQVGVTSNNMPDGYILASNRTVVKSIIADGDVKRKDFKYGTGYSNKQGNGFIGYDKIETLSSRGEKTVAELTLNEQNGKFVTTKKTAYKNDTLISETTLYYDTFILENGVKFYPLTKEVIYDNITKTTNQVHCTYDSMGNIISASKYTATIPTNTSSNTTQSYAALYSYNILSPLQPLSFNYLTVEKIKIDYTSSGNYGIKNVPQKIITSTNYQDKPALTDTTIYTYQNGLPVQIHKRTSTTTNTYNEKGLLTSETVQLNTTDADPQTTIYQYQNGGRFKHRRISSQNDTVTFTYDTLHGLLLEEKNNFGATAIYHYDKYDRIDTVRTSPIENEIIYHYVKLSGNIGLSILRNYKEETINGNSEKTYFDCFGRLVATVNGSKDGNIETQTRYNHDGLKNSETFPFYAGDNIQKNYYKYDVFGRVTAAYDQDKAITNMYTTANGETTVSVQRGENTSSTVSEYSISNGVTVASTTNNAAGDVLTSSTPNNTVNYVYQYPQLPKIIYDNSGDSTVITYDNYGRVISKRDGSAGLKQYEYDNADRLAQEQDANGTIKRYFYDQLSRLEKAIIKNTNNDSTIINYQYVTNGIAKGSIQKVFMIDNTTSVTSTTYIYNDTTGLPIQQIDSINEKAFTTSYIYYKDGKLKTKIFPNGLTVTYTYYQDGSIDSIVGNPANGSAEEVTLWKGGASTALGNILQSTLGGSIKQQQLFDYNEQLISRHTVFPNAAQFTYDTLNQYYDYDKVSNLLTYRGSVPKPTFTPDANGKLSRLRSNGWSEVFTFDNSDQLKSIYTFEPSNTTQSKSPQTITYDGGNNIMQKYDVGSYIYKANNPHILDNAIPNSSLFSDEDTLSLQQQANAYPFMAEQSLTYTPYGRAKTIEQNEYKADFVYTASLNRTAMNMYKNDALLYTKYYVGGYEEKYYAASADSLTPTATTATKQSTIYIPFPDGTLAVYISSVAAANTTESNGKFYYVATDHLGSIIAIGTPDSGIVERHSYDAYGRRRNPVTLEYYDNTSNTASVITSHSIIDRGFTGHEHLDEFGLINANARLYDPWLGQFISPDPLADWSPGISPYSYCNNNPVNYIDILGLLPEGNNNDDGNMLDMIEVHWTGISYIDYSYLFNRSSVPASSFGSAFGFGSRFSLMTGGGSSSGGSSGGGNPFPNSVMLPMVNVTPKYYYIYYGDNIWEKAFNHYQTGEKKPLHVSTSALDFSKVRRKDINDDNSVDLYKVYPLNQTPLTLGKITLIPLGENWYKIENDKYNFNIEWNKGWTVRNVATVMGFILHVSALSLIFGGEFDIIFHGIIYIEP
jgi:RHS repeat-associated protein